MRKAARRGEQEKVIAVLLFFIFVWVDTPPLAALRGWRKPVPGGMSGVPRKPHHSAVLALDNKVTLLKIPRRSRRGFFILLGCLGGFLKFGPKFRGALLTQPRSFAQTPGTVVASEVVFQPGGKTKSSWRSRIVYSYQVNGKSFSSDMVNFDWITASEDRAVAVAVTQRYTVGQTVPVFYLPSDPAFSVLDPGEKGTTRVLFFVLLLVTALCLKSWIYYLRLLRRRR